MMFLSFKSFLCLLALFLHLAHAGYNSPFAPLDLGRSLICKADVECQRNFECRDERCVPLGARHMGLVPAFVKGTLMWKIMTTGTFAITTAWFLLVYVFCIRRQRTPVVLSGVLMSIGATVTFVMSDYHLGLAKIHTSFVPGPYPLSPERTGLGGSLALTNTSTIPCSHLYAAICEPYHCNVMASLCIQACDVDSHCMALHRCDPATHTCVRRTDIITDEVVSVIAESLSHVATIDHPLWELDESRINDDEVMTAEELIYYREAVSSPFRKVTPPGHNNDDMIRLHEKKSVQEQEEAHVADHEKGGDRDPTRGPLPRTYQPNSVKWPWWSPLTFTTVALVLFCGLGVAPIFRSNTRLREWIPRIVFLFVIAVFLLRFITSLSAASEATPWTRPSTAPLPSFTSSQGGGSESGTDHRLDGVEKDSDGTQGSTGSTPSRRGHTSDGSAQSEPVSEEGEGRSTHKPAPSPSSFSAYASAPASASASTSSRGRPTRPSAPSKKYPSIYDVRIGSSSSGPSASGPSSYSVWSLFSLFANFVFTILGAIAFMSIAMKVPMLRPHRAFIHVLYIGLFIGYHYWRSPRVEPPAPFAASSINRASASFTPLVKDPSGAKADDEVAWGEEEEKEKEEEGLSDRDGPEREPNDSLPSHPQEARRQGQPSLHAHHVLRDADVAVTMAGHCAPYFRLRGTDECLASCRDSSDCQGGGKYYVCVEGECRRADVQPTRTWLKALFSMALWTAIYAVSVWISAALVITVMRPCSREIANIMGFVVAALAFCGVVWHIFKGWGSSSGAVGLLVEHDPFLRENGSECAMTDAQACAPFQCDMNVGVCLTSCLKTADCASGLSCVKGECTRILTLLEMISSVLYALLAVPKAFLWITQALSGNRVLFWPSQVLIYLQAYYYFFKHPHRFNPNRLTQPQRTSLTTVVVWELVKLWTDGVWTTIEWYASWPPFFYTYLWFFIGCIGVAVSAVGFVFGVRTGSQAKGKDRRQVKMRNAVVFVCSGFLLFGALVLVMKSPSPFTWPFTRSSSTEAASESSPTQPSKPTSDSQGSPLTSLTPSHSAPAAPLTCKYLYDPQCGNYKCGPLPQAKGGETSQRLCLSACTAESDCQDGLMCVDGACGRGHPIGWPAKYFFTQHELLVPGMMMWITAVFLFILVLLTGLGRCHRIWMPFLGLAWPFFAGVLFLYFVVTYCLIRSPFPSTMFVTPLPTYVPKSRGNGTACTSFEDMSCAPYKCDTFVHQCYSNCTMTDECDIGYACVSSTCVYKGEASLRTTYAVLVFVMYLAHVTVFGLGIATAMVREAQAMLAERRVARAEAEAAAEAAELKRKKEENKVKIDIHRSKTAKDFSLPSPAVYVRPGETPRGDFSAGFPAVLAGPTAGSPTADSAASPSVVQFAPPKPILVVPPTKKGGLKKIVSTDPICSICFASVSTVRMVGRNCHHGFCDECAKDSLSAILENGQFPARCPGCRAAHTDPVEQGALDLSYIPAHVIEALQERHVITETFASKFIYQMILFAFAKDEILTCPVCDHLNAVPEGKSRHGSDATAVTCAMCEVEFCRECNNIYRRHRGKTCVEFAKLVTSLEEEASFAKIFKTTKKCPNCGTGISRPRGHACHHISPGTGCPNCHFHFCIVCLNAWGACSPGHGTYCDERCDCQPCPECKPNRPCVHCHGNCPVCQGTA